MEKITKRQNDFIEAALDLVSSEGFSKLTIRNVAEKLGLKEASLYRHFRSKLELLRTMLNNLQSRLVPYFEQLDTMDIQPTERFGSFIEGIFIELEKRPSFAAIIFSDEIFHAEAELRSELQLITANNIGKLSEFFSRIQDKGLCRDDINPKDLALITLGTIKLTITRAFINPEVSDLEEITEQLKGTLIILFGLVDKR